MLTVYIRKPRTNFFRYDIIIGYVIQKIGLKQNVYKPTFSGG